MIARWLLLVNIQTLLDRGTVNPTPASPGLDAKRLAAASVVLSTFTPLPISNL
jgi:hypothetical protein